MNVISNHKKYDVKNCKNFLDNLIGMMFQRKQLPYGLKFKNCSLHTFFCFQNLDIIMVDKENNIIKIYPNTKPNRVIPKQKNVDYILEFCSGVLNLNDIKIKN